MSFNDLIKKSVLNQFAESSISLDKILATLAFTFLIALYIFVVYYLYTQGTFYDKNFNSTLVGLAIITCGIVLALQSSLVISLGMVGALSIVRFRTAIKEPKDLLFLFWSISVGIICGAGMFAAALIVSLVVSASIFLLELVPLGKANMLLLLNLEELKYEIEILECVKKYFKFYRVRSRNVGKDGVDIIIQLRTKKPNELLCEILELEGIKGASLISQKGEVNF